MDDLMETQRHVVRGKSQQRVIPGLGPTRPLLPDLLDLDGRRVELDRLGVQHQVLATWMDAVGYALPAEAGARWSRLYNECLAETLREAGTGARFGGVADRHPDLRIVLVHAGGFYPDQAGRLQRAHALGAGGRPALTPLDGLRWFHCDTITHFPAALRYLVDLVGPERVMLGSDAPFDVRGPDPVATVRAVGLEPAAERALLEDNARAFFGLAA